MSLVTEAQLDQQIVALFDKMRIEDEAIKDWIRAVFASKTRDNQQEAQAQRAELLRQLRDREASLKLQFDSIDRSKDENAGLAGKVFELSQTLRDKMACGRF